MSNIAQLAAPKPLYEAYNDLAKQIVGLDKPRKRTNLGFEQDTRSRVIRNSRLSLRYIEHVFIRQKHTQDNLAIAMGALGNALYYAYDDKGNTTLEKLLDDAKSRLEKYDADTADANLEILKTGDYRAVLDLKTRLERELESSDSDDDDEDVEFEETLDAVVDVLEFRFYKKYAQDQCNKVIHHLSEDENALITAILRGISDETS